MYLCRSQTLASEPFMHNRTRFKHRLAFHQELAYTPLNASLAQSCAETSRLCSIDVYIALRQHALLAGRVQVIDGKMQRVSSRSPLSTGQSIESWSRT